MARLTQDAQAVLDKIHTRGYWQFNVRPPEFNRDLIARLAGCRELVQSSSVLRRGWDCPHMPTNNQSQGVYNIDDHAEAWTDWDLFKEVWQMYRSGQFVYVFGVWNDWMEETSPARRQWHGTPEPGTELDALEVVLRLTELVLFARRVVASGIIGERIFIQAAIIGTAKRKLTLRDPRSIGLLGRYVCHSASIRLPEMQVLRDGTDDDALSAALVWAERVLEQFQFNEFPLDTFREYQKRLVERRL